MNELRIVERDLLVIRYVYEMKFSSSFDVYKMYFESGGKSSRYCFVRLKKLVDAGYLKLFKNNLYRSGFYFVYEKGLSLLRDFFRDHLFPKKAPTSIDMRFFEHDKNVAMCRTYLEKEGLAKNWTSERVITHDIITKGGEYRSKYMLQNLQKSQIPDGLFETRKGEVCAFELEYTLKSARELKIKLSNLNNESKSSSGLFKRVLIVAGSNRIKNSLEAVKKDLNADFKIIDLSEVSV
jgi:hypothetical protein